MKGAFLLALLSASSRAAAPARPHWPITINEVQLYDDGGSVGFSAVDGDRQQFHFCIDGQLMTESPRSFYLNATHPRQVNAGLIAKGSREEKEFARQLRKSLDRQLGTKQEKIILAKKKLDPEDMNDFEKGIALLLFKIDDALN